MKWSWTGDGPAYGSPIIADIGGTRQLIVFSQRNFVGVGAENGALLWSVPFEARSTTNSITPLVYGGNTLIVSGQGKPLTAYIVANKGGKWVADLAWENPADTDVVQQCRARRRRDVLDVAAQQRPVFLGRREDRQDAVAVGATSGGNAAITRSGDLLFVLKDTGELMVGKATPGAAFTPMKTYTVATSATWAPPVISGNRIFVKDVETLALWTLN